MSKINRQLRRIPGLKQIAHRLDALAKQNEHTAQEAKTKIAALKKQLHSTQQENEKLSKQMAAANKRYEEIASFQAQLAEKLNSLKPAAAKPKSERLAGSQEKGLFAENHSLDAFYLHFENKFRGDEAVIKKRLEAYLPQFTNAAIDYAKHPVVDLGCGRGEMLSMLYDNDIRAIGVDLNESMVQQANDNGFKAVQDNAIDYIKKQKTGSLGAITGFHLIEHVPFEDLVTLFEECQRALTKDGFIIFETPNPENLMVATLTFYLDPSHLHPLPPSLIEFLATSVGLRKTTIKRLHPTGNITDESQLTDGTLTAYEKHSSTHQDYAVIAYK